MGCCTSTTSSPVREQKQQDENVAHFLSALQQQEQSPTTKNTIDTSALVCRIFKFDPRNGGIDENQRLSLTIDPATGDYRPFVFFSTGSNAFEMFLKNKMENIYQSMLALGLTRNWMEDSLKNRGLKFAMIVLPKRISRDATWDGLLDFFGELCPEIKEYCEKYREQCKADTKNDFVNSEEFKRKYKSIDAMERASIKTNPELYLAPKYFLEKTEKTFIDFRALMWSWGGANQLFQGDGFTIDSVSGQRGEIEECLVENASLKELKERYGAVALELDVVIPEE